MADTPKDMLLKAASLMSATAEIIETLQAQNATLLQELESEREQRKVAEVKLDLVHKGLADANDVHSKVASYVTDDGGNIEEMERMLRFQSAAGFSEGMASEDSEDPFYAEILH